MTTANANLTTNPQDKRSSLVQSVERALILLNELAEQQGGLTLTELCERVGLHSSTVHRLLATLRKYDYVRQDSRSKVYRLGFQLLRVGQAVRDQFDLRNEVMQDLESMARETQELANLINPTGHQATYIAQINGREGQGGVHMFTQLGVSVPLYCTAVGKSIMAHMPDEELDKIIEQEGLTAYAQYTITNVFQLQEELEEIKCNGYAVDNQEREMGVRCVGEPYMG